MFRSQGQTPPCPLCGRLTRAHSQIEVADLEGVGRSLPTRFQAVICRDCAVALVLRSQAAARQPVSNGVRELAGYVSAVKN